MEADEIRRRRLEAGLTQSDVAQLVGVKQSMLSRWENGRSRPSQQQNRLLAEVLLLAPQTPEPTASSPAEDEDEDEEPASACSEAPDRIFGTAPLPELDLSAEFGRIFRDATKAVVHGDALSLLREIPSGFANLIFLDPPYNIGKRFVDFHDRWPSDEAYVDWCKRWLEECLRILADDGTLYLMTSTQAMPYLDIWLRSRIKVLSRITWRYDSSGVQARSYFGSMYEPILHCVANRRRYTFNAADIQVEAKTGAKRKLIDYRKPIPAVYNSKKVPGNVWYFPRVRYRMLEYEDHPSQKPEALLERIVRASSHPGDIVLDPFAGTFTTGAVAAKLGRRFVGIESQINYVKAGLRRLELATHMDGEELVKPEKTYVRRNGARRSAAPTQPPQIELFRDTDD